MSSSKMTLLGFSRWMVDSSDDLFKAFDELPAGIDKDVLVNNILLRGGEFEVIYSDPHFMQESIYTWLAKWQRTIEKWLAALAVEYDPLNNYDRHEEYTDTEGIGDTETRSGTRTDSRSGGRSSSSSGTSAASTNTTGSDTGSQGTENQVSAFDASTYQAKDRSDTTTGSTTSASTGTTSTNTALNTESESSGGSESTADTRAASRNRLLQHTAHLFGNIGVTTSQEMLQAELSIAEWNLYDHITDLFLTEYIIPVYV